MFLYGMKLYVFKHLILCSNFSTFKYNDSVDTNIYLQAHGETSSDSYIDSYQQTNVYRQDNSV